MVPLPQSLDAARESINGTLAQISSQDLEGGFDSRTFVSTAELVKLERSDDFRTAQATFVLPITDGMANQGGNIHGGCVATLLDTLTSVVLFCHTSGELQSPWSFLGVTQNLNITYVKPGPIGQWLEIDAKTIHVGRATAVIVAEFYVKDTRDGPRGPLIVQGTHSKADNASKL